MYISFNEEEINKFPKDIKKFLLNYINEKMDSQIEEGKKFQIEDEEGFRTNINVGILYIEAWLKGNGCVPLYNLMEDAATAEISRAQIWQWLKHKAKTINGKNINKNYFNIILKEELEKIKSNLGQKDYDLGKFKEAAKIFYKMSTSEEFEEFLTLPAYELI